METLPPPDEAQESWVDLNNWWDVTVVGPPLPDETVRGDTPTL
jgi:hypothetical protein